jgi:phage pi2 protein 07
MLKTIVLGASMGLFITGCSLFGKGSEEQPAYQVLVKDGDKEIRKYDSYLVAKTTVTGTFKEAQSAGFRILAGYIFGKNESQKKMAMTAPVLLAPSENNSWTMTFNMPSRYTLETLPVPTDKRIKIEQVEQRHVAAITFSGFWNESKVTEKGKELEEWITKQKNFVPHSKPMFAGYNPPWTLPFLRRNEVMIE